MNKQVNYMKSKTIAAVATPNAPGGIGIIRISGDEALEIAGKVFEPVSGEDLSRSKGYRAYFGSVRQGDEKIDQAVCLIYRAPHSYTGENVAEINCHGGLFVTKQVLRAVIEAGAEPAAPGEFTKRAFLNGKMDLAGSESVMSLISASGKKAAAAALNTLEGNLSGKIKECRDKLISVSASLAAWVDYPDEDIEETGSEEIMNCFTAVKAELEQIISRYDSGKALTRGVDTVIAGKPNVGKSTVMNMLSGYQRSIVTDVAGTTRDVVEEEVLVGDIILRIADTAGIRETDNTVEKIGVDLAEKRLDRADLVIAVFDGNLPVTDEDRAVIERCKGKTAIALINKSDLPAVIDKAPIEEGFDTVVEISAATGEGRQAFEQALEKVLMTDEFDPYGACLTGERQRECCRRALQFIDEGIAALKDGVTLDAVNVCADCAIDSLFELTGEKASAAVVDEIFSKFCVGK